MHLENDKLILKHLMSQRILVLIWTHRRVLLLNESTNESITIFKEQDVQKIISQIVSELKKLQDLETVMVLEPTLMSLKLKGELFSSIKGCLNLKKLYSVPFALLYSLSKKGNLIFIEEDDNSIQATPVYNYNILNDGIVVIPKGETLEVQPEELVNFVVLKLPIDCRKQLRQNTINTLRFSTGTIFDESIMPLVHNYINMISSKNLPERFINMDWYELKF